MKQKTIGRSRGWEAYLTVEAVLVFPIVLYVCIFIIYSGFYIYDRCAMSQDAYRAALRGSSLYRQDKQEVYNTAEDTLKALITDKYIAAECTFNIVVDQEVKVTVEGNANTPFRGPILLGGTEERTMKEEAKSKCLNPVFFIRMCRQLKNTME